MIVKNVKLPILFGILISFLSLVSLGISGSSVSLEYNNPFFSNKIKHVALPPQSIRSDEWLIYTPMAIGQYHHQPAFPILNQNIGWEGENMLVFGMVGMPVQHITAFAKPATWGFFLFPFKQALAWYWWFPFFGCLFALWWVFCMIIPKKYFLNFLLSLLFCVEPYIVAWSYWPAYIVFFPCIAFCAFFSLLKTKNKLACYLFGLLLGLSLAGFVLTLYPPWQISLAYLFLLLSLGSFHHLHFNKYRFFSLSFAIFLASLILGAWWHDAKNAIQTLAQTAYPGGRVMLRGGNQVWSSLFRGYTNISSLYKMQDSTTNPCEIASFYFLFLPILGALWLRLKNLSRNIAGVSLFILFCFFFMFHGIPPIIAKISLWGQVTTGRLDLALGLACVLLYGLLLNIPVQKNHYNIVFAHSTACIWSLFIIYTLSHFSAGVLIKLKFLSFMLIIVMTYLSSVFLMLGYRKNFILTSLLLCFITVYHFNPSIGIPGDIKLTDDIQSIVLHKRVLTIDDTQKANALISAGISTLNGVMYYPQKEWWKKFGIEMREDQRVNRYQHLVFKPDASLFSAFMINKPGTDRVEIRFNPDLFDFNMTGAALVLASAGYQSMLERNPTLRYLQKTDTWVWFEVIA